MSGYVYFCTVLYIWLGVSIAFHLPILHYDMKTPVSLFSPLFLASAITLFVAEGLTKVLNSYFVFHVGFKQNSLEVFQNSLIISATCCLVYSQCGTITDSQMSRWKEEAHEDVQKYFNSFYEDSWTIAYQVWSYMYQQFDVTQSTNSTVSTFSSANTSNYTSSFLSSLLSGNSNTNSANTTFDASDELGSSIDSMCVILFSGHVSSRYSDLPMVVILWATMIFGIVTNFVIERISVNREIFQTYEKKEKVRDHRIEESVFDQIHGSMESKASSPSALLSETEDEEESQALKTNSLHATSVTPPLSPHATNAASSNVSYLSSLSASLSSTLLSPTMLDMVPWYALLTSFTAVDMLIHLKLFVGRFDMRTLLATFPQTQYNTVEKWVKPVRYTKEQLQLAQQMKQSQNLPSPNATIHQSTVNSSQSTTTSNSSANSQIHSTRLNNRFISQHASLMSLSTLDTPTPPPMTSNPLSSSSSHTFPAPLSFVSPLSSTPSSTCIIPPLTQPDLIHTHPHHLDSPFFYDHFSHGQDIWIDWMADCGDGWNSSYQVARLLAQPHLNVWVKRRDKKKGKSLLTLPRAKLLLIGGDLAYPNPTRDTYEQRLFAPFQCALPPPHYYNENAISYTKPALPGGLDALRTYPGPVAFCIPGNHDWFDGLQTFLRYICYRDWLGGWLIPQEKSYFALKLPHNW
jgi:hypothetical protein